MATESAQYDRITTRLAELDAIRTVLSSAADRLEAGWTQGRWRDVDGVCLVSAIRLSGRGQVGVRSLDLVWHALYDASVLSWTAPASVRSARVRDLTRWNDRRGRTVAEVAGLLTAADRLVLAEADRLRGELGLSARRARRRVFETAQPPR